MLALRCDLRISASIQVVEISSLTEHLLTECDRRDSFGKCYRCSEAVLKEELPRHLKTKDCNREPRPWVPQGLGCGVGVGGQTSRPPAPLLFCPRSCVTGVTRSCLNEIISAAKPEKLANRCPLCHENFSPGEEVRGPGWGGAVEVAVGARPATGQRVLGRRPAPRLLRAKLLHFPSPSPARTSERL